MVEVAVFSHGEAKRAWANKFIFKDMKQKLHFSLPLIPHWLKPSHKTTLSYKVCWEMWSLVEGTAGRVCLFMASFLHDQPNTGTGEETGCHDCQFRAERTSQPSGPFLRIRGQGHLGAVRSERWHPRLAHGGMHRDHHCRACWRR